jgi:hypothetical protein
VHFAGRGRNNGSNVRFWPVRNLSHDRTFSPGALNYHRWATIYPQSSLLQFVQSLHLTHFFLEPPPVAKNLQAEVEIDRRAKTDRRGTDRRKSDKPVAVERRQSERRVKVPRRRQIDPTTCERDYSADEIEFMHALDAYKRTSGRMFPTCSEILEVIRGLGYVRVPQAAVTASSEPVAEAVAVVEADAGVLS